jgi:anti-sigma B factor antagonist
VDLATAPELERELLRLLSGPASVLTVDLSSTSFMDSQGLHALAVALRASRANKAAIVLRAPTPGVRRVLEISGADRLFQMERR